MQGSDPNIFSKVQMHLGSKAAHSDKMDVDDLSSDDDRPAAGDRGHAGEGGHGGGDGDDQPLDTFGARPKGAARGKGAGKDWAKPGRDGGDARRCKGRCHCRAGRCTQQLPIVDDRQGPR